MAGVVHLPTLVGVRKTSETCADAVVRLADALAVWWDRRRAEVLGADGPPIRPRPLGTQPLRGKNNCSGVDTRVAQLRLSWWWPVHDNK